MIESSPENYPNLIKHLKSMNKYITSSNKPFGIHRARSIDYFEGTSRIIGQRKCMLPSFSLFDNVQCFMDESVNSIIVDDEEREFLLAFINSRLVHFFLYHFKKQGQQLQIDKESIIELKVPSLISSSRGLNIKNEITQLSKKVCSGIFVQSNIKKN